MMNCLYCGGSERLGTDHIVPKSRGGLDIPDNLFTACLRCNARKGSRLPSEWREDLPAYIYAIEKQALSLHPPLKQSSRDRKTEVISIKCTEQQKAALEVVAAREGLGLSTWVLRLGLVTAQKLEAEERQR
ncbi:hypothetical protein LCGC14_1832340 [marine sediment metagenome]|uniref:HNH endonuclease 5 domain-containing protein n=1 Tax=marine sediment metagenome TaxID=412755 RepID=A0A0F9GFP2_9ZZZZ